MNPRSTTELEILLRAVAREIAFPDAPDVRAEVVARLVGDRRAAPRTRMIRLRIAAIAAAVAAITSVGIVTVSDTARRAVADWLGVDGIRITFDDDRQGAPVGTDLALGKAVSFDDADAAVDFELAVPQELGPPDDVYLRLTRGGGEVSLVWAPRAGLPESRHTGVGAVLTQFLGMADPVSLKKVSGAGTDVTYLTIDGRDAFFIEGAPHVLIRDPNGGLRSLPPRLAGNTLVWDGGAVTYRLEADVDFYRALEIAESLR